MAKKPAEIRTFGWNKTKKGFKFTSELLEMTEFWTDVNSKHKRTHISIAGENESLCANMNKDDVNWARVDTPNPKDKSLCKNCARVAMGLDPNEAQDYNVKQALKTVSKKRPHTARSKRMTSIAKTLRKSKEELQEGMENAINSSNIKLPDEITSEISSLQETLQASLPVLTVIRKTAMLNLDRSVNEFKKADPDANDYEIIRETHNIKSLVKAIDQIKQFAKQL